MFIIDFGRQLFTAFGYAIAIVLQGALMLLGVAALLAIGWLLSDSAARLTRRGMTHAHLERWLGPPRRIYVAARLTFTLDIADLAATLMRWLIVLIFFVALCDALLQSDATAMLQAMLAWLPRLVVGLLLVLLGVVVARKLRVGVVTMLGMGAQALGDVTLVVIVGTVILGALVIVGVGPQILTLLLGGVILAVSIGIGLAFGLGGRDAAKAIIDDWRAQLAGNREESWRGSLHALADPAKTVVPSQSAVSSLSARDGR